jgi:hypothetical protein
MNNDDSLLTAYECPKWLTPKWIEGVLKARLAFAQRGTRTFETWLTIGEGLTLIRDAAMCQANTTKPQGRHYARCHKKITAFADAMVNAMYEPLPDHTAVTAAKMVIKLALDHDLLTAA